MEKVIVAGSREGFTLKEVVDKLDFLLPEDVEIVSGTARGVDKMGEAWAINNNKPLKQFPADWARHGKAAGHIRNAEMADYADTLIAFCCNYSRGTTNMIEQAEKKGLNVITFHSWTKDYGKERTEDSEPTT